MKLSLGPSEDGVRRRAKELANAGLVERLWRRDTALWPGDEAQQRAIANRLGWLTLPAQMRDRLDEIQQFAQEVRAAAFRDAVVLGMGGSSLAPEVLARTFGARDGWPAMHVLDSTDPGAILALTREVDVERTLFFVSSKSGTTVEALTLFAHFHALVKEARGDRAGENFVAITDTGTPLQDLARDERFRRVFTNPGDVGGRYSALSYFGLVPAAVAGIDVERLLEQGAAASQEAHLPDSSALALGAVLGEMARAGRDKLTFIVTPEIGTFAIWLEQLVAESTGKLGRGILPVAGEPLGTPMQYGDDRLFVQIRMESATIGTDDATVGALLNEGKPVVTIDLEEPYDLGHEFFRWEFAVAVAGHVLELNPFDEPNVTESKNNTSRVLEEFERTHALDAPGVETAMRPVAVLPSGRVAESTTSAIADLLAQIEPGDYFAITAFVRPSDEVEARIADIRTAVRDPLKVATTFGYGPRYLHSTGQLHKGGPERGVFLQITADEADDVEIPGRAYTFGQLKLAQAIGDFQSLAARGRPALRVHLGPDVAAGLEALHVLVRETVERVAGAQGA